MQVDYVLMSILQSRFRVVRWIGVLVVVLVTSALVMYCLGVIYDNSPKVGVMFNLIFGFIRVVPSDWWPVIGTAVVLAAIFAALLYASIQIMLRSGALVRPSTESVAPAPRSSVVPLERTAPAAPDPKQPSFPDQGFADWLTKEYEYGVHSLLNGAIETEQQFTALATADDKWVRNISDELKRHGASEQEAADFAVLQEVPVAPRFHPEPVRDHLLRMINVRLNRLKKAIDRYSERPAFYALPARNPRPFDSGGSVQPRVQPTGRYEP